MKKIVFFSIALVFSAIILGCLFSDDDEGKAKAIICNRTSYAITYLRFGSSLAIGTVSANECTSKSYEIDPGIHTYSWTWNGTNYTYASKLEEGDWIVYYDGYQTGWSVAGQ